MFKKNLRYLPLLVTCLISLIVGIYSLTLYTSTFFILNKLKVYVKSIHVLNEPLAICINFTINNPSNLELKLVYFRPEISLNGVRIPLEEPSFIKYPTGSELTIPSMCNVSIPFSKRIDPSFSQTFWQLYNENSDNEWFFNVYFSLKNVPLVDVSTLQRYVYFVG